MNRSHFLSRLKQPASRLAERIRNFLSSVPLVKRARQFLNTPQGLYLTIALIYLVAISAAEAITTEVNPGWGIVFHIAVLVALLIHSSLVQKGPVRRLMIVLSLAPLIRFLSLCLPLTKLGLPVIYWYLIIGAPLFLAAFVASRVTDLRGSRIGWTAGKWPIQALFGISGFGLGFLEYMILQPGPLAPTLTVVDVLVASFILLVFTGLLEELIFRGLMQSASMQLLGKFGLVYVAILFAVLHLGYHSFTDLVFVLLVGLLFGWMVWKTGSLLGAALSHGIANISLYVLFPLILTVGSMPVASTEVSTPSGAIPSDVTETSLPAAAGESPLQIVVDNDSAGFFHVGENFWLDTARGFGGSFRWTYAAQYAPDLVVTWIPNLQGCGKYAVEVYVPPAAGATESARYQVNFLYGQNWVNINQAAHAGDWVPLGYFDFDGGQRPSLQLSNLTGDEPKLMRWVGFDAARWIYMGTCGLH